MRIPGGIIMTIWDNLNELKKVYKATDDTIREVIDIFEQGDYRYTDPWNAIIVAGFIDNNAIRIERKEEIMPTINHEKTNKIKGPQEVFKLYAKQIAEKKGFKVKEYESSFLGGKADVFAVKNEMKLLVECCSCRISKAIDYLNEPNTLLWIMLRDIKDKIIFFEFSRGKSWSDFNKFHNEYMESQIHKHYDKLFLGK